MVESIVEHMFLSKEEKEQLDEKISQLFEGCENELKKNAVVKYVNKNLVSKSDAPIISFEEMSNLGLVWRINREVLHPLGLALTRDPDRDISEGCVVAPDLFFEYSKNASERNNEKFRYFSKNREAILKSYLEK